MRGKIEAYLKEHEKEIIESTRELVQIQSVASELQEGEFPFGEKSAEALQVALKQFEKAGFKTKNIGNYCGYADFGENPKLGILAHVDIVPAGEGWDYPPYDITNVDGVLYGRGVTDDKGPLVSTLYAMRALKELGIPLKHGVRVIMGGGEEKGSAADIKAYEKNEKWPEMIFSPDAEYPVVNFEGGMVIYNGVRKIKDNSGSKRILSIYVAGPRNMVPGLATAEIEGFTKEEVQQIIDRLHLDVTFDLNPKDGHLQIAAHGVNSHAAKPQHSVNALTGLLTLLHELPIQGEVAECIASLLTSFPHGDKFGKATGYYYDDKELHTGCTSYLLSVIQFDGSDFVVMTDARFPYGRDFAGESKRFEALFKKAGLQTTNLTGTDIHHVDKNSRLVRTLAEVLQDFIKVDDPCVSIHGGTYAHDVENAVAFGPLLPENAEKENNIHSANEYAAVDELLTNAAIYAEVIRRICG